MLLAFAKNKMHENRNIRNHIWKTDVVSTIFVSKHLFADFNFEDDYFFEGLLLFKCLIFYLCGYLVKRFSLIFRLFTPFSYWFHFLSL